MESKGKSYVIDKTCWFDEMIHLARELERAGFRVDPLNSFNYSYRIRDRNSRQVGILTGDMVATCESRDLEDFLDNYHFGFKMEMTRCIEQSFPIKCHGRDENGDKALKIPVEVKVRIRQNAENISSMVEGCPHNVGGHAQRCKASHPEADKVGEGIGCPYSFDIPYALERKK